MPSYNTFAEAHAAYVRGLGDAVTIAFRTLLETKHVYQSVTVDDAELIKHFWSAAEIRMRERVQEKSTSFGAGEKPWMLTNDYGLVSVSAARPSGVINILFTPPHAKVFCKSCQRIEPFNLVHAASTVDLDHFGPTYINGTPTQEQIYTLSYLCQSCKKYPEVFLVRRTGAKLTLSGRSPMEHISVPAEIPKEIARYYSGAVIAYQSGQTLAALFMLRTTCEQWARRFAASEDKADVAIEKYMASLPEDFKTRFPSLRDIYSDLSADIHAAKGSDALFENIIEKLSLHFRARQLYEATTRRK